MSPLSVSPPARAIPESARRRLGAAEAAVVIAAIAAVTMLAALGRPIPAVLTALVAVVCLLLLPGRPGSALRRLARLLTAVGRITGQDEGTP
jgi:hypothetical protein